MNVRHFALPLCLALAACAGSSPSPRVGIERDPLYAVSPHRETSAEELARFAAEGLADRDWPDGTVAFVGEVVEVGRSPGVWSGILAVFQRVHYRVVERLRGDLPESDVVVQHPIVGPPTTEKDDPRLSSAIWCEGARLVVICGPRAPRTDEAAPPDLQALFDPYREDGEAGGRLREALARR